MNLAGLAWSSEWPLPPRGVVLAGDAPVKKMEGGRLRVGCFRDSNGKRSCSKLLLNRGASRKQIPISVIDIRAHRQKMTGNEPDAKAILPKPRSVQKANSYQ